VKNSPLSPLRALDFISRTNRDAPLEQGAGSTGRSHPRVHAAEPAIHLPFGVTDTKARTSHGLPFGHYSEPSRQTVYFAVTTAPGIAITHPILANTVMTERHHHKDKSA
jgi:hypothetical protein